ncbi:class I SAM-dependent methyltransferase [Candidatus Saccharibacteria bacterium]|nr:class I SAM-dependent methyltransferase [Candidatus Saccharibacteria bacterium]
MSDPKPDRNSEEGWVNYFEQTTDREPSALLTTALERFQKTGTALELGSGGGSDTRFLVEKGFTVTAVDYQQSAKNFIQKQILEGKVNFVCSAFEDLELPANQYDLINAEFSLPFVGPENFNDIFAKIKQSLQSGGVFVGQFFGDKDEWNKPGSKYAFQTEKEALELLQGLHIIRFENDERDGVLADHKPKHWHQFNIIAQKPE